MTLLDRQAEKKARRDARERELAKEIRALPDKKYGAILADPPWRFEPYSRQTGMDRAADNHYPTMTIEQIVALSVGKIAATDCVLFLWATAPMLLDALRAMNAWGFGYRSNFVWVKQTVGTGYWSRNLHEHLLIGVRGHPPAPAPGQQWASVITANRTSHSAKPERFFLLVETYYPNVPKIELFRRGKPRPGWDAWGNEVT